MTVNWVMDWPRLLLPPCSEISYYYIISFNNKMKSPERRELTSPERGRIKTVLSYFQAISFCLKTVFNTYIQMFLKLNHVDGASDGPYSSDCVWNKWPTVDK
jgi:hypothetical protein